MLEYIVIWLYTFSLLIPIDSEITYRKRVQYGQSTLFLEYFSFLGFTISVSLEFLLGSELHAYIIVMAGLLREEQDESLMWLFFFFFNKQ